MTRLIVIAGPYQSGKMPLARKLIVENPDLKLVHRDDIRSLLEAGGINLDERTISKIMEETAERFLDNSVPVIICAWNMERSDMLMWTQMAMRYDVPLAWLDVRTPEVAAMIPPLEVIT